MAKLRFVKMEGCGNDYVYFDCFRQRIDEPEKLAVRVADRHFGVGGDGMILILPSAVADGRMRMFNQDGSEGRMCGNGVRCVGKYLYDSGAVRGDTVMVETLAGVKKLTLTDHGALRVGMGCPVFAPENIPVLLDGSRVIGREVMVAGGAYRVSCVSMGNPHCVVFTDDITGLELDKIGPRFERDLIFPERVNTEFVRVTGRRSLSMRVWERGSGETLACGTGACAAVVAAVENGFCDAGEDVTVRLLGGELVIRYGGAEVEMTGPARRVFEGEWEVL